jgi:hypothetical protein
MYEELESIEGLVPACKLESLPFDQLNLFLGLAKALGDDPLLRFYLLAYRQAKRHAFDRLRAARDPAVSAFRQFELSLLRGRLFDHPRLKGELTSLLGEVAGGDAVAFRARAAAVHAADTALAG